MTRILICAAMAVIFAADAHAGDGKDRIDRRDGISTLDHRAPRLQEGRASTNEKSSASYHSSWDFKYDPRREDDR